MDKLDDGAAPGEAAAAPVNMDTWFTSTSEGMPATVATLGAPAHIAPPSEDMDTWFTSTSEGMPATVATLGAPARIDSPLDHPAIFDSASAMHLAPDSDPLSDLDPCSDLEPSLTTLTGGIDHKYTGLDPKLKMPIAPANSPIPSVLKKTPYELASLASLIDNSTMSELICSLQINEPYLNASFFTKNGTVLSKDDPITFVMIGRGTSGLLPVCENHHTILVMPKDQFNELKDSCLKCLPPTVHILVINSVEQPWMDTPVENASLALVTTRRIATFLFAHLCHLNHFIMIDDNLKQFNLFNPLSPTTTWTDIYLSMQAMEARLPIKSIATENIVGKSKNLSEFGSKCFMINQQMLQHYLPDIRMIFSLFPEHLDAWGEDYFFQAASHHLITGRTYQTLNPELISLIRSSTHKNVAKKTVAPAVEILISDLYQTYLHEFRYQWAISTIYTHNANIKRNLEEQQKSFEKSRKDDLFKAHAAANRHEYHAPAPRLSTPKKDIHDLITEILEYLSPAGAPALRPHQLDAMAFLRHHLADLLSDEKKTKQLTFHIATGCGKTLIQVALALAFYEAADAGQKIVIITPYQDLVQQLYEYFLAAIVKYPALNSFTKIHAFNRRHVLKIAGMTDAISARTLAESQFIVGENAILICCNDSFKKLANDHPDFLRQIGAIFADEHHIYHPTIKTIKKHLPTLPLLKFSATPPKLDASFAQFNYSIEEGINAEILAPYKIDILKVSEAIKSDRDKLLQYLPTLIKQLIHPCANEDEEDKFGYLRELKGIIYFDSQAEARSAADYLSAAGLKVYIVYSDNQDRRIALKTFIESESPGIVLAVDMLKIGFDLPELHWFINLKTKQNANTEIQILGRVLRPHLSKTAYGLVLESTTLTPLFSYKNGIAPYCTDYLGQLTYFKQQPNGDIVSLDPDIEMEDNTDELDDSVEDFDIFIDQRSSHRPSPEAMEISDEPVPGDADAEEEDEEDIGASAAAYPQSFFSDRSERKRKSSSPRSDEEPRNRRF